jgi:hypothetical protein
MIGLVYLGFGILRAVLFFGVLVWLVRQAGAVGSDASTRSVRQRVLGVAIGVAGALFIGSLVAEFGRAMVIYLVAFTVGLAPLALLVVGIRAGLKLARRTRLPQLSWPAVGAAALFGWSLAVVLPWGLRLAEMQLFSWLLIPAHPFASSIERTVHWGDRENDADELRVVMRLTGHPDEALERYAVQLAARGWRAGPKLPNIDMGPGTAVFHRDVSPQWASLTIATTAEAVATGQEPMVELRVACDPGDRG